MQRPPDSQANAKANAAFQHFMFLHRTDTAVVLEQRRKGVSVILQDPVGRATASSLVVDKLKGDPSVSFPIDRLQQIPIYGVLGIIRLLRGRYLILIEACDKVGRLDGFEIFKVTKILTIPIPRLSVISEDHNRVEKGYLDLLQNFIDTTHFFFSYEYELTHSLQRLESFKDQPAPANIWERADRRFFWNRYLCEELINNGLTEFIVPFMQGNVDIRSCQVKDKLITYVLISRRSCLHAGTRYHARGADPQGNVANFVETEQIIIGEGIQSSFVITRGSIPLIWRQKGKSLKPRPEIENSIFNMRALKQHFEGQMNLYNKQVAINLLNQNGVEANLGETYEVYVKTYAHPDIRYIAYDFHDQCKGNKFENILSLLESMKGDLDDHSFFSIKNGQVLSRQKGVVRVNCLDCLDRTNVVQSVFAEYQLGNQLKAFDLSQTGFDMGPDLNNMFKQMWADNADLMSIEYTGTGALKTDLTRTGKRSMTGALNDSVNSAKRYVQHNFLDEGKQDAIDLFLGVYELAPCSNMEEGVMDGVFRFRAMKYGGKATAVFLELNTIQNTINQYNPSTFMKKSFPLASLKQIMRYSRNHQAIRLVFDSSAAPRDYVFAVPEKRDQFIQATRSLLEIYEAKTNLSVVATPPASPATPKYTDPAKFYVANFSLINGEPIDNPAGFSRVPLNHEIYVLTARVIDKHGVKQPYSFKDWTIAIQKYLGTEYDRVCQSTIENTSTILVLALPHIVKILSNIETLQVKDTVERTAASYGSLAKKTFTAMKTSLFGRSTPTTQSASNSTTGPADENEKGWSDVIGQGVSFSLGETSFCFLNTGQPEAAIKIETVDIGVAFHHVFWLGNFQPKEIHLGRWIELVHSSDEDLDFNFRPSTSPLSLSSGSQSSPSRASKTLVPTTPKSTGLSHSPILWRSIRDDRLFDLITMKEGDTPLFSADKKSLTTSIAHKSSLISDLLDLPSDPTPPIQPMLDLTTALASSQISASAPPSPALPPIATEATKSPEANRRASLVISGEGEIFNDPLMRPKEDSSGTKTVSSLLSTSAPSLAATQVSAAPRKVSEQARTICPVAISFSVDTTRELDLKPSIPPCFIVFSQINVCDVKGDMTWFEPYIVFDGSFLTGGHTVSPSPRKGTGIWDDDVKVECFTGDKEYLKLHHVQVQVWCTDLLGNPQLAGAGLVVLKNFMGDGFTNFVCPLSVEDEQTGTMSGRVRIVFFATWGEYKEFAKKK